MKDRRRQSGDVQGVKDSARCPVERPLAACDALARVMGPCVLGRPCGRTGGMSDCLTERVVSLL